MGWPLEHFLLLLLPQLCLLAASAALECHVRPPASHSSYATQQIQGAIDRCRDGGTVHFAPGAYLTAALAVSGRGVRLHLPGGATLLAGTRVRPLAGGGGGGLQRLVAGLALRNITAAEFAGPHACTPCF